MSKKIVIVGGVAGGASTAARLRRLDEEASIIMFEKGEYISFANCGLPYYIGGVISEREQLLLQTVEEMSHKFKIDIRILSEVIAIDREQKQLTIKNLKTDEIYCEKYDKLVLSPGAKPTVPPIKGLSECKQLFTLRNIPDTDRIKAYIDKEKPQKAVVIGGGFIGLEMVENLKHQHLEVTLIEATHQVMAPLDIEMASIIHEHLIDQGINLILNQSVEAFRQEGHQVVLSSGEVISTDMIIMAIGVTPETTIAKAAGLEVTEKGSIIVDEHMRTSDKSIYALGDAVSIKDFVSGEKMMIPLAWPANRQGRVVADHICGRASNYRGTLGSAVAKVFDYTVAATGNNEKMLKHLGRSYEVVHIHPNAHASYYPGAFPIAFKMLFDPRTGEILGAQGVGMEGVEKRIDLLAVAIKGGLKVADLQDIEPCYAPPYNSAKDPVNMLGYYAANLMEGLVENSQWYEVDDLVSQGAFILDVREPFELVTGVIPKSINIPLSNLRQRITELPKEKEIYVTCQVGQRGYVACRLLMALGYKCKNIDGGMKTYLAVQKANEASSRKKITKIEAEKGSEIVVTANQKQLGSNVTLNACGLQCPGPIRKVYEQVKQMEEGEILKVKASDPGFTKDIGAWCDKTQNTLIETSFDDKQKAFIAYIQKGIKDTKRQLINPMQTSEGKEGATMVVFSGDLDKAIASFIIATGAASMGKPVTLFFTFWGLNILKRKNKPKIKKDKIEKLFDIMLPKHTNQLGLSHMNMGGMGAWMIKKIMKKHQVDDIDTLIKNAIDMGVKIVACSMSMELMGIKKEEFIEGVEIGGVASYLGAAEDSGLNLFI